MGLPADNWYMRATVQMVLYDPIRSASINVILGDSDTWQKLNASSRVRKLIKRKTITIQEADSFKAMIDSKDIESLELAIALIEKKEKIRTMKEKLMFWKRI